MKKIALLVIALMMVASVALAENITPGNLADLKGTWIGVLSFNVGANCPAELTILNDTVPVQARLTVSMVPDQIAVQISASGGQNSFSNDEGRITTQGSLMFAANKNFMEFSLKGNKLDGWFYYNGARGDMMLHKK